MQRTKNPKRASPKHLQKECIPTLRGEKTRKGDIYTSRQSPKSYQKTSPKAKSRAQDSKRLAEKKVYVSNLPTGTIITDLKRLMSKFGKIKNAYICNQRRRGAFVYGFVIYKKLDSARAALEAAKLEYKGVTILIRTAVEREEEHPRQKGESAAMRNPSGRAGGIINKNSRKTKITRIQQKKGKRSAELRKNRKRAKKSSTWPSRTKPDRQRFVRKGERVADAQQPGEPESSIQSRSEELEVVVSRVVTPSSRLNNNNNINNPSSDVIANSQSLNNNNLTNNAHPGSEYFDQPESHKISFKVLRPKLLLKVAKNHKASNLRVNLGGPFGKTHAPSF